MRGLAALVLGVAFAVVLHGVGFSSWDQVHAMFAFTDLRLTLTFMLAVSILVPGLWLLRRRGRIPWPRRAVHRGTIIGGVLFGVGWALSGACPSIAWVQLGEGQLGAAWTLLGIVLGNALYGWAHPRFFGWPLGSCGDD